MKYILDYRNMIPILLSVAVLSMSFPYGFPLFGILSLFFSILLIITKRAKLKFNFSIFLFAIIALLFFVGIIISGGELYSNVISDSINIISLFFVWIVISSMKKEDWDIILNKSSKLLIATGTVIALISLYKFYLLTGGVELPRYAINGFYPDGTSLVRDRNMFGLALLLPMLMSIYRFKESTSFKSTVFYTLTILILSLSLFFTGSRRTWIALAVIAIIYLFVLSSFLKYITRHMKKIIFVVISIIIAAIPILLIIVALPNQMTSSAQIQLDKLRYRFSTLNVNDSSELTSPRTDRWNYAIEYFNQQPFVNQIFGSGFEYLDLYAQRFSTSFEGFPHNPILSALLYSGIIGALAIILFYLVITSKIIYNMKVLNIFFLIFYAITYLYTMVSSNSIFSNTLFLMITFILIAQTKTARVEKRQ